MSYTCILCVYVHTYMYMSIHLYIIHMYILVVHLYILMSYTNTNMYALFVHNVRTCTCTCIYIHVLDTGVYTYIGNTKAHKSFGSLVTSNYIYTLILYVSNYKPNVCACFVRSLLINFMYHNNYCALLFRYFDGLTARNSAIAFRLFETLSHKVIICFMAYLSLSLLQPPLSADVTHTHTHT